MMAIRNELIDLEDMNVRTWLMRHSNEKWYRGNGEWEHLSYRMQQRLYWIGSEQRAAKARLGALGAQTVAMAVIEDTRKMAEQARAAAKELSERYIGPRLGRAAPPPPPHCPPMSHGGYSTPGELRSGNGKVVTYEDYMREYQ